MNKSVKEDNFGNIAFDNNADKLLKLLSMIAYNHNLVSAISYNKDILSPLRKLKGHLFWLLPRDEIT